MLLFVLNLFSTNSFSRIVVAEANADGLCDSHSAAGVDLTDSCDVASLKQTEQSAYDVEGAPVDVTFADLMTHARQDENSMVQPCNGVLIVLLT